MSISPKWPLMQVRIPGPGGIAPSSFTAITLDASCTGTGSTSPTACGTAMTVTAGDTIVCGASGNNFDPAGLYFNDVTNNVFYDTVSGLIHPNTANSYVAVAVLQNSASGSIKPQVNNFEDITLNINCYAFKGVPTAKVLDGGAINQTKSAGTAAANPTSGTAASPTNANEVVIGSMVRPTASSTQSGTGWAPSGTLTAAGTSYPVYNEYQIQTTAVSQNAPFTSASAKYSDIQIALLNAASTGGYRALTGLYAIGVAKTNGASVTTADLNGATTTLASTATDGGWALTGSAATYNTAISPSGTGTFLIAGVPHTFGDAATSITLSGAQNATQYAWTEKVNNPGTPRWLSMFFRMGSSGTSTGQFCDANRLLGGVTDQGMTLQALYTTGNGLYFFLEPFESGSSAFLTGFSLDTDYWVQTHAAGVNERFNQLLVYAKSGATWSLSQTLNYDLLCVAGGATNAQCSTPPTVTTHSAVGSSASTTLVLTVGTSTANGQTVTDPTGSCLPWPTLIESGGGTTSIVLSQKPTCSISGTVNFYAAQPNIDAATNGTATSGSTALTVIAPATGTINIGDRVGGTNIANGTLVTSGSGTSWVLSQPTTGAVAGGVAFWSASNVSEGEATFGKFSSCTIGGAMSFSAFTYDPLGTWGAFAPN